MTQPTAVRNLELDYAWRFVETTGVSIFLTGKAGTGKTTFLRSLKERSRKTMIVVAPTGVAAINAGGVTVHSFFQLPFTPFIPGMEVKDRYRFSKEKIKIIRALDLLVIDEISMVRSDLLDAIDTVLRRYCGNSEPFGGVQLLMIGDLQQLVPVVTPEEERLLRGYYDTPFFFGSHALSQTDYVTIQLNKVYRQQDTTFINLLNAVRTNRVTSSDLQNLNRRVNPDFNPPEGSDYIRLTTHNVMADDYNRTKLLLLTSPERRYKADMSGTFPEFLYPTDLELTLKVGAQVMFIKNDPEHRFYNGKIGHVTELASDKIRVRCAGEETSIEVERSQWENTKYSVNEETQEIVSEVQGSFTQFPLRLAWAITIHKSQGLTFEHAIIDAGRSFAPGQVYVALSRCRSLGGIVLATPITHQSILSDSRVESYIARQEADAQRSIARLPEIEDAYYRSLLQKLFDFREILGQQERLTRLLAESYHNMFPVVTRVQGEVMEYLRKNLLEVALKWSGVINNLPLTHLKSGQFQERIRNSAAYFIRQLEENIESHKSEVRTVKSANKVLLKRLNSLRDDLYESVALKIRLLRITADEGFDVDKFLRGKQKALLSADPIENKKTAAHNREKSRVKENKVPSHQITLSLFLAGLTPKQIAAERNITESTVRSHLLRFIPTGEVRLSDLVSPKEISEIESVIKRLGHKCSVAILREELPDKSPMDIYAVLENYRNRTDGDK